MKKKWLVVFAIALTPEFVGLRGAESGKASFGVQMVYSVDPAVGPEARREIVEERAKMISELTATIRDAKYASRDFPEVAEAMSMLAEMRAKEAIPVLVDHIGFPLIGVEEDETTIPYFSPHRPSPLALHTPIERLHPAVPALIKIGEPCIDEVIRKSATASYNGTEARACAAVLRALDRTVVRSRMEQAIRTGKPKEQEKLQRVLSMLDEKPMSLDELRKKLADLLREIEARR